MREGPLEIPSRSFPGACDRKLASAERRLRGAIAHGEPRARLVAEAERVRRAHLGVVKARIPDFRVHVFDLAAGYGIDGLIGLSFLRRFNYEVRSIEGEIRVERAASLPAR